MISREQFDAYNRAVSNLSGGASKEVESRIWAWLQTDEGKAASVAECREYAKEVMEGTLQVYDEAAASLAAQWYDGQAAAGGKRLPAAVTATVYSPKTVDETARYQAKKLLAGDARGFARCCGELASNDVLRSLNETIIRNVGRDRRSGVRFARVPTGAETCTFCLMLASRGAVYHSRKTAGEFRHFHRRCDCKVVPGFEDDPDAELVEGVRPDEMRDQWWQMEKIDATEGLSETERDELKRRVLEGGELPQDVRRTNPTSHMRKSRRSGSGWMSAAGRLQSEVRSHGFTDATEFYRYLGSRTTRAELEEASSLCEQILGNADATPTLYDVARSWLDKSEREIGAGGRSIGAMKRSKRASSDVIINNRQLGKKAGKHAREWGLDPSASSDRERLEEIIAGIVDNADSVDTGIWRGQPGQCTFYRKGNDLVIVNSRDEFVTIMKGGGENKRYRGAIGRAGD